MTRAATLERIEGFIALGAALVLQVVAVVVIGDLRGAAPRDDAGLQSPTELTASVITQDTPLLRFARIAAVARGERLMTSDLTTDLTVGLTIDSTAAGADTMNEPAANAATEASVELGAETADIPATEAAAEAVSEPADEPAAADAGEPADELVAAVVAPLSAPPAQPKLDPAPAPPPALAPLAIPASLAIREAEFRMLALMNASRLQAGLVALTLDASVSVAARRHSAVEAEHRYVYHDGPDGTSSSRNVPACGSGWYGENTGKLWSGGVDVLHREFMAEPWEPINHRTNIMDANFRRAGIGAVQGPDAVYITVVFCR